MAQRLERVCILSTPWWLTTIHNKLPPPSGTTVPDTLKVNLQRRLKDVRLLLTVVLGGDSASAWGQDEQTLAASAPVLWHCLF